MLPVTKYGKGSYQMTSVKKMVATNHFLGLSSKIRNCEIESYDECRTKNLLAECECVPWELQNMRVFHKNLKKNPFVQIFRMEVFAIQKEEVALIM